MMGGLFKGLLGQTDARVRPAQFNTKAGQAAIANQTNVAQQRAAAQIHGLAASARGSSAPMALRAAMRQSADANARIGAQGAIAQQQLQQQAAMQNAQLAQQARMQNANIQMQNDQGFGRFVQGAAMAGAGAMMLSDARAKHAAFLQGREYGQQEYRNAQPPGRYLGGMGPQQRELGMYQPNRMAQAQPQQSTMGQMRGLIAQGYSPQEAQLLMEAGETGGTSASELYSGDGSPLLDAEGAAQAEAPQQQPPGWLQAEMEQSDPEKAQRAAWSQAHQDGADSIYNPDGSAVTMEPAAPAQAPELTGGQRAGKGLLMGGLRRISDEDSKESEEAGEMEFPDGVRPVAFEYKEEFEGMPGAPPGEHVGVLAQDLEKSPEGETVVSEDPGTGLKQVDTAQLTMLLTAKLAELDKKLDQIAGKKGKSGA